MSKFKSELKGYILGGVGCKLMVRVFYIYNYNLVFVVGYIFDK